MGDLVTVYIVQSSGGGGMEGGETSVISGGGIRGDRSTNGTVRMPTITLDLRISLKHPGLHIVFDILVTLPFPKLLVVGFSWI